MGAYGTIWPVVHQHLGVRPDMGRGELDVIPQLPPGTPDISGENIRLGDGSATVSAKAEGDTYTTTVDPAFTLEDLEELTIGHTIPRDARVGSITLDDPERGPLGYLVRAGKFTTEAGALKLEARLEADGYADSRTAVYTGEDGGKTTGPWVVHILKVNPDRYDGTLEPELATGIVPERELLTSISARTDSLAAINGGYFVIEASDGTPGDLAGISVLDGGLVSEAVDGRTSLVLPEGDGEGADVAALSDNLSATSSDGAKRIVDGKNRKPGFIRGCGGDGGDTPTERPKHDFTCADRSELIQFTPIFGVSTEPGPGAEAVLNAAGRVMELREGRGGLIPPNGSVLSGTGVGANWLRAHASARARETGRYRPRLGEGLRRWHGTRRWNGRRQRWSAARGERGRGDHRLRRRLRLSRRPGVLLSLRRAPQPAHPRGRHAGGDLLLVAVDGRAPGYSVGASFEESAEIMDSLAAEEAVNLDGGGSTGMTLGKRLVTRPSDTTGERPIGDAIVVLPE